MFFWFIGLALWSVWFVFHDAAIDLRVVIAGVLLSDLFVFTSGYTFFHSVVGASALLALVMLLTIGHRQLRRRMVFIPFGVLLHLVFDGAWSQTKVFWWPLAGLAPASSLHPHRSLAILVLMEVVGILATGAFASKFGLLSRDNARYFFHTGRLNVEIETPVELRPYQGRRRS